MMFKQIGELIREIDSIYSKLNHYYDDLKEHLNDELSTEIVKYITKKKELFSEMLKYYSRTGNKEVLKTWIQFTPDYDLDNHTDIVKLDPDMDMDSVHEIVVSNETWLQGFYEYIVQTTGSSRVKELFNAILERQRKDTKDLASAIDIIQDI
jgi:hypothetical protein